MIKASDLHWLAGLLEGEGCFYSGKENGKHRIRILLSMTDEDVVRKAYETVKLGRFYGPYYKKTCTVWEWHVSTRQEVVQLAMTLYPLMGTKRQMQIRKQLDIWKSVPYTNKKEKIFQ